MSLSGDAPPFDPDDAASREFSKARKGFDPTEVRVHLTKLTEEIKRLRATEAELRAQLEDAATRVPDVESLDPAAISRALGAETVRTPGRLWRYAIDDAPPVDDDVNPGLLIPTGNVQLTWLRVPSPPWNAQRLLRGKVNGSTFLGAPAGTLLFLGVRAVREFQLLDDDALWRIDYHFAEQTKPLAGGGFGGWNHFYREEADDGEHWLPIADADGNPPYAAGDFSALFQFE